MPQVTVHIQEESGTAFPSKEQLASDILGKHGLSLSKMHPQTSAQSLQPFHTVVVPDLKTARTIVAELQSNGISAFVKPEASAP